MEVRKRIIIDVGSNLRSDVISIISGLGYRPEVITQNINDARVFGVNHEAMIGGTITAIHRVALGIGHGRQSHCPSRTIVFGNIDASMVAVSIDTTGVDDIMICIGH